ncbi:MAG: 23S rRNA (uracil(1939)-C(5))-methyltransferase RlmD [Bacillaceae bacterium]|nr:23S rRNA (uracil(1939)-C(5))-methyltransferase RlmD [Bacillaceae bacterium]
MAKKKAVDAPVEKNQYIELEITGLNHEGNGVGRYEGFTIFVPRVLPGEVVDVKVIKVLKNYGVGRLVDIKEESPHRVEPECPIFKRCGGCSLQHLAYEEQLRQKRQLVIDNLERIGGLVVRDSAEDDRDGVVVHPTIGMADPRGYRNKAQVPVGEEEGGLVTGFYAPRSHELVPMESCAIQHDRNNQVVQVVREAADRLGIPAYDEEKHRGVLRHIVAKTGFATGEVMVVLVTNGDVLPHADELVDAIRKQVDSVKSIVQNINAKRTNVIFGERSKVLWGEKYIYDRIGDIQFAISARSFYQVNPVQTEKLYNKALAYADLSGTETVIDAYCGIGTISLFMARKAKQVYGVEVVPEAISDAKRNARLNGIENVKFAVGEAEKVIPWWYAQGVRADVVVVDPPRKGCDRSLLDTIVEMKPERMVYVSCNPATLARDLRVLEDGGFRTVEVQPVDMFPHTGHVECCVLLVRKI